MGALAKAEKGETPVTGKTPKKQVRMLTAAERAEKTKNWPKGPLKEPSEAEQIAYQKRTGRGWHE